MDASMMLKVASWLFLAAAAGGLVLAGIRLGANRNPPIAIAYAHGMLAAAGLTLLVYAVATAHVGGHALAAMWLLLGAAGGGSAMNLLYHWRQQPLPKALLFGHARLAAAGVVLLLLAVY
jgi:hypothetical protein